MNVITSINPELGTTEVPEPVNLGADTIWRLNSEGMRGEYEPLTIVDECRDAMRKMPEGHKGIVLGSGDNSSEWRHRGWKTLDIDPMVHADFTADANHLENVLKPASMDYICAEAIRMDPNGIIGVSPARLLHQANMALKPGGKLIIVTANYGGYTEVTLPEKDKYARLMQRHGFQGVIEVHPRNYHQGDLEKFDQKVVYYGVKKRTGYIKD
jgi:SAM-dependent methyltransferase